MIPNFATTTSYFKTVMIVLKLFFLIILTFTYFLNF